MTILPIEARRQTCPSDRLFLLMAEYKMNFAPRRQFMQQLLSLCCLMLLSRCHSPASDNPDNPPTRDEIEKAFDEYAARYVGAVYDIDENDIGRGFDVPLVRNTILKRGQDAGWDLSNLASSLDRLIQDEFASGETATIRGWIFSRTEADILRIGEAQRKKGSQI